MSKKLTHRLALAGGAAFLALTAYAADQNASNAPPGEILLLDSLGQVVKAPTNAVHTGMLPPAKVGLKQQTPEPTKGTAQPGEISERSREARAGFRFLPSVAPPLAPYLASQDEFGNTAARPGALIPAFPLEPVVQGGKYWLSQHGLRYSLQQTLTAVNMTGVQEGDHTLGYYTFDFQSVWAIYDSPGSGTAGWIASKVEAKSGLGHAGQEQDARRNLGTITDPTGIWSSVNGVRVPQLAWQQSLREGEIVAIAGMVDQSNYLDQNAYAQSGRGQFINSALISSLVLPLPDYNFGLNLQWQPLTEWYGMLGASAGKNTAGYAPWTDFSLDTCSLTWELGYTPGDVFGLGPGIFRIQPFVARVEGHSGGGLGFNVQQKLGARSPFGWFGRFGFGGEEVSSGAAAQVGTGFVMKGPFEHWPVKRTSNDLLGLGFVWSQPSATSRTVYHENEYILEAFYTLQLSPTVRVQPDFQYVIHPAFNGEHDRALVFQLQLVLSW